MAFGGGGDRTQLRPNNPDGTVRHGFPGVRVIGNHKGNWSGLNIANPRPGTVHQYCARNSQSVMAARQRGWVQANPERDGKPAYMLVDGQDGTMVGAGGLYPDLVHMVTTEDNYRRLMDEQHAANRAALDPGMDSFLDNITDRERHYGHDTQGNPVATRFAMRNHSVSRMEGDRVLEQLTPTGVLREE